MTKRELLSIGLIIVTVLLCFRLLFSGLVPLPLDSLVGLYHPYRDNYSQEYPRGIPYKNPLITDSVLQQIPWKHLSFYEMKKWQLPLWNPYAFSGYPLLANVQSSPFYPGNLIFFIVPFISGWVMLIILQVLLGGLFMYYFLRSHTSYRLSAVFSAVAFSLSGFFISWMEWGTVAQSGLWLPAILLSIDRLVISPKKLLWQSLFIFFLFCSLSAGHLQTFVYVFLVSLVYLFSRLHQSPYKALIRSLISIGVFLVLSSILWFPQIQFILLSGRDVDLSWQKEGFFIPLVHLIQFVAPDFFGNPATGNYFGVWNYGEMLGYVGITTLLLSTVAVIKKRKFTVFFLVLLLVSLLFSVDSLISRVPYLIQIPFISSTQPTRLIFLVDFSLAVLAALGFDVLLKREKWSMLPLIYAGILFILLLSLFPFHDAVGLKDQSWLITSRNLILPLGFLLLFGTVYAFYWWNKTKASEKYLPYAFLFILVIELLFVMNKYNAFTKVEYFYPSTRAISYLQENLGNHRVLSVDRRALPANISVWYKLQSVSGYDPLYLKRYGEYISALQRGKPDISQPFGFQRIITPDNYTSPLIDLLGVRYIVSLTEQNNPKLKKVFTEGQTLIYENREAYDRAFFVSSITRVNSKEAAITKMFQTSDLRTTAMVEQYPSSRPTKFSPGNASITSYTENMITLRTENKEEGFLILTDVNYPIWHAFVDGREVPIYTTDYLFRGIVVPGGTHTVQFNNRLFSL